MLGGKALWPVATQSLECPETGLKGDPQHCFPPPVWPAGGHPRQQKRLCRRSPFIPSHSDTSIKLSMQLCDSGCDSYGVEMLYHLGHVWGASTHTTLRYVAGTPFISDLARTYHAGSTKCEGERVTLTRHVFTTDPSQQNEQGSAPGRPGQSLVLSPLVMRPPSLSPFPRRSRQGAAALMWLSAVCPPRRRQQTANRLRLRSLIPCPNSSCPRG